MLKTDGFLIYLLLMAGVTYLIRMIPLVLFKKKIENKFILSFLHYIPYTVLSVMTVPAIFYAATSPIAAVFGFLVAVFFAFLQRSLVEVAAYACGAVLLAELIIKFI